MKPQYKRKYIQTGGVVEALVPPLGSASVVKNCRWEDRGGWVGDMGVESWWKFPTNFFLSAGTGYLTNPVDAVYVWKRSDSNDIYTFVEQGGVLYYIMGNKNNGAYVIDHVVIDSDRHIRKNSEVGTQFVNLGKRLLILNGVDKPILFSGDRVYRDFGFTAAAGLPNVNDVEADYQSGTQLSSGTAIWFPKEGTLGLGTADDKISQYSWKVSYISDTGSESPLSATETESWTSDDYKYAATLQLPLGPEGTVARRIYRTKNIPNFGEVFYFVKQINENASRWYADYIPDTFLTSPAPTDLDSVPIETNYRFGDVWDGRLWLAKDNTIIYSERSLFEQFPAANVFDLSNLTGGSITGIRAYYNNLIVFRETAINIISATNGRYTISTIHSTVGTTASNTIIQVPQLGIVFLNESGVWSVSGGLNGGSSLRVQHISSPINKTLTDMNFALLHRATGAYSPKEEIVWFHYPDSVNTIPNRGCMLHLKPEVPLWSFFGATEQDEYVYYPVVTTTLDGTFLMGTHPIWTDELELGSTTNQLGPLQVLTHSKYWGQKGEVTSLVEGTTITVGSNTTVGYSWESSWWNFLDTSAKHRVYAVELEVMSYGDNGFDFSYAIDYSYDNNETSTQKQAKNETVYTINEYPVLGPADVTITKSTFTIGESRVNEGNLIQLRYDCATELMSQFKFSINSTTPFHVLSYNLLYDDVELPVLNQNTRLRRGQHR
jgi:hypothetical protein